MSRHFWLRAGEFSVVMERLFTSCPALIGVFGQACPITHILLCELSEGPNQYQIM